MENNFKVKVFYKGGYCVDCSKIGEIVCLRYEYDILDDNNEKQTHVYIVKNDVTTVLTKGRSKF